MGVTSKFQESMDAEVQEDSRVLMEFFNPSKIKGIREDRVFRAHQHIAIADLHELASQPTEDMSLTLPRAKPPSLPFNYKKSQYITKSVTAIATATLPNSGKNLNLKRGRNGAFLSKQTEGYSYIQSRNLSTSQAHVVRQVYDYFCAIGQRRVKESTQCFAPGELLECGIKPPRLLLTGEPGSGGKSYITDTLCELASVMKIGIVAATSYNGIAAVNIDGNKDVCNS
jgi:hypothetical protein